MGHTNIEIKQKRMMSVNVKTLNRCEGYISTMELFNIASITLDYGLIMGDEQPSFSFFPHTFLSIIARQKSPMDFGLREAQKSS